MRRKLKVLLIEPFHSGSHKAWAEGLKKHSSHDVSIVSHPGSFWRWRIRGSALTLAEETQDFKNGSFLTIYLAPHNYHRVHVPCRAKLQTISYVPGELFSVNQTTAEQLPNLFARNERLICKFSTDYGAMIQVLVGAMLVAGIKPAWSDTICEPAKSLSFS